MNAAVLIRDALSDGVACVLDESGGLLLEGHQDDIARWLPMIRQHKPEIVKSLTEFSFWWRVHFPDGRAVEVSSTPQHNLTSIQASYPAAIRWEPFTPEVITPDRPMTTDEVTAIRRYCLAEDCQPDEVANILNQCQRDADARAWFLRSDNGD